MSENLQNLLRDALLNNSYDYEAMHNTLKSTWMTSFSYLYTLQKSYIEYEELFYFSNDTESRNSKLIGKLYLDKSIYANFDIDYDLIHVFNREEFRLSKYYGNKFTIEDMVYNPKIFDKIPIIIIDDKVIWDYKIRVKKDCTTITLPFRRKFVIENERNSDNDDIIYVDHKIQVLVVDNIYYQRFTLNKSNIYFNTSNKSFKINKKRMEELTTQQISEEVKKEFKIKWGYVYDSQITPTQQSTIDKEIKRRKRAVTIPTKTGTMMCSIHFPNRANKGYELGTALIPLEDRNDDWYYGSLTDDIVELLDVHNRDILMSVFFMNRLYQHTFYTGENFTTADNKGASLMVIQKDENIPYKTPIPIENFMVFKKSVDSDGFILEKNTSMITMYYPNIYRIKDAGMQEGDIYKVYYYYYDNCDLEYTVLFDFYFKFLKNKFVDDSLEKIINDIYYDREELADYTYKQRDEFRAMFIKIISYQYHIYKYGESDFLNRYLLEDGNSTKVPTEYKDETLREWIKDDPWVLQDYVLEQKKLGDSYHLYTNTIDLDSRLRTNTKLEMGDNSKEFESPRYVFAFGNEKQMPLLLDCRIFVDGILVGDVYQERKLFMDYFYIPQEMVTKDSFIELEIFPSYTFEKEITFDSIDDVKTISIIEPEDNIFPTVADIYLEDSNNDYIRYSTDNIAVTNHYKEGDYEVTTTDSSKPVKFTRLNTFDIKPTSEDVVNLPFKVKFSKKPQTIRFIVSRDGYAYIGIKDKEFNFNTDYIRVFRNGRLIPRQRYAVKTTSGRAILIFYEWFKKEDIIYIDITPYRYTQIYYKDKLEEGQTLIDLSGVINKPFDIRYYDVYMNGRKLSSNNVFAITPWQITLVNLKSTSNLVIFEKERDYEYFGLDYTSDIYYFSINDIFDSSFIKEEEKNKLIKDIIDDKKDDRLNIYPNTDDEEPLDFSDEEVIYAIFNIFYFYELIPKGYVNPDVLQFNKEVIQSVYEEIYNNYYRSSYDDSNTEEERLRRMNYPGVLSLDPDVYIESEVAFINMAMLLNEVINGIDDYFDENNNLICNIDRNEESEHEYVIDGRVLYYRMDKSATVDPNTVFDNNVLVYEVGHSEDVPQEYLDQTVDIQIESNLK